MTTAKMGTHQMMKEIVLSGSEEESETIMPAETVLDTKTEYDWKTQHSGTTKKLEDRFNREVHIDITKQPPPVMDNTCPTVQAVTCAVGHIDSSGLDNIVELQSTDEEQEVDFPVIQQ